MPSVQKLERKKAYKSAPPEETVDKIKGILSKLGISTEVIECYNEKADVYSCTVYISNPELKAFKIGTNGKGMTREYSLASGYAEFMERLQCGILLSENAEDIAGGVKKNKKECKEIVKSFFEDNFGKDEKASEAFLKYKDSFTVVPFYTYDGKEAVDIPYGCLLALTTSNGMCAGNDKCEAVIQGVSEIFERYAQKEIMLKKLCLPTVPNEYFEGSEILEKLKKLSESKVSFEIKDCSLGMGLPVVGLCLKSESKGELFHLGADPSPITALERCVTEIFQGVDDVDEADFCNPSEYEGDELFWKYQLQKTSWGGNIYPPELSGENYSWNFEGFAHTVSYSNEDDLNYYLDIISSMGKKLYIRDCSYFGFNSYFCYIPSLSGVDFSYDDGEELKDFAAFEDKLKDAKRIGSMKKSEIKNFAKVYTKFLEKFWYYEYEHFEKRFFPAGEFSAAQKGIDFILALIYAASGMNAEAADAMENYIVSYELSDTDCDFAENFIVAMRTGQKRYRINPDEYFPVCPDCKECKLSFNCCKCATDALKQKIYSQI